MFFYIHRVVQPSPQPNSQTKQNPVPTSSHTALSHSPCKHQRTSCPRGRLYAGHGPPAPSRSMWPCIWPHTAVPEVRPHCRRVGTELLPMLSSTALCAGTTFRLSLCLLTGLGAIMNNAAMNIHIKNFVWSNVLSCFRYIPRSGILGHMVILCLIFDAMPNCFHGDNIYAFQCLHILTNACVCPSFL